MMRKSLIVSFMASLVCSFCNVRLLSWTHQAAVSGFGLLALPASFEGCVAADPSAHTPLSPGPSGRRESSGDKIGAPFTCHSVKMGSHGNKRSCLVEQENEGEAQRWRERQTGERDRLGDGPFSLPPSGDSVQGGHSRKFLPTWNLEAPASLKILSSFFTDQKHF